MSYKWITIKGSDGERSYKISAGNDKHYVYDGSGNSLGSASSQEDAISIIKSKYGSNVWSVDIGDPRDDGCFPSSTLILTPSGSRRIAEINVGDQVIAFNKGKATPCISTVTQRLDHSNAMLWEIHTSAKSEPLRCTAIHAYLTPRGWVQACQLRMGDELLGFNFQGTFRAKVTEVTESNKFEVVHNLYTTGEHNFIADSFVAHNFSYFRVLRTLWHRVFIDPKWKANIRGHKPEFVRSSVLTRAAIEN